MSQANKLDGKYLSFALTSELYGIEVQRVREIVGMLPITFVPGMAMHMLGVVNLRGKVIPLVDLRLKLGLVAEDTTARTCIVVVQAGSSMLGLVVDSVCEVLLVRSADLDDTPDVGAAAPGVVGLAKVKNQVVILLDVATMLQDDLHSLSFKAAA